MVKSKKIELKKVPKNKKTELVSLEDYFRIEAQDKIHTKYAKLADKSDTWFLRKTPAYRFTNEPLGDIIGSELNLDGPILNVTASGDTLCLFAGMQPDKSEKIRIDSVDVSEYANAWGEWKWQAFLNQSLTKFRNSLVVNGVTWENFPFDLKVSRKARNLFNHYRKSGVMLCDSTDIFQPDGYACPLPGSTGFINSNRYKKMQDRAQGTKVWFYNSDLAVFFEAEKTPKHHYSTIYISNVLDHITKIGSEPGSKELDLSEKRMAPIITQLNDYLSEDGTLLINFQWGERAKENSEKTLKKLGLKLKRLPNKYEGCGYMYIASR